MHKAGSMRNAKRGASTAPFARGHGQFILLMLTWDNMHRVSPAREAHPSLRVKDVHRGAVTQAHLID